ncbi:MAG: 8-amino-7-oxononanoate synthase [Porphyromonas sp.]|nr:8-amino-7-oxononanoate synthase [Porphyromonas sp.]
MQYRDRIDTLKEAGAYRTIPKLRVEGKYVWVEEKRYINLAGNDYLGISTDTRLRDEFKEQALELPFSSSSSRLLTGNSPEHEALEEELSHLYGGKSALLFDSGYHANLGILPALSDDKTLILADRLVHASIIDGIRLSGRPFRRFKHNSIEDLEAQLCRFSTEYETIWIVVESLYSMDGDFAPLPDIVALKQHYPQICIYVDEAHAVGTIGAKGLGCVEELGFLEQVDILIGTMGKALCSVGAFALCSAEVRELLVSTCRPLIFSTALPPVCTAWSLHVMHHLSGMRAQREHLNSLVALLKERTALPLSSYIVPVHAGSEERAIWMAEELRADGFFALPIRKPTVPPGGERVRLSLSAALTEQEVERLAQSILRLMHSA